MTQPNPNNPSPEMIEIAQEALDKAVERVEQILTAVEAQSDWPNVIVRKFDLRLILNALTTLQARLDAMREALKKIRALIPNNCAAWGDEQEVADICDIALAKDGEV